MRIESLAIREFRNISQMELKPAPGVNIICGDNAQGKTNLLEAVWLFTGARSFRGARDSDFIPFGGERAALNLDFFAEGRDQTASIAFGGEQRAVFLNEVKQERASKLAGVFCAVVFSPDHLAVIKEGPDKRRRMLDISLCQAYPKYQKALEGYERSLRQRGRLLRDAQTHASLLDMVDVWDENIVEYGAYITWMRVRYVARLAEYAGEVYAGISLEKEKFEAAYKTAFDWGPEIPGRDEFRELLRAGVKNARSEDIRLATTTVGPHRDDVDIRVDGVSARSYGSQGQQRSCVLALKLAECRILEESAGEPPVVLLDDVMSELDAGRRAYLLERMSGKQVLITCCEDELFKSLKNGSTFRISGGKIVPRGTV